MKRKIIRIDEEKCNGCGLCAAACHEGAIGMVDGKAKLLREDYCDGLGDCLPACPTGAIRFEEREAPAYDQAAVLAAKRAKADAADRGAARAGAHPLPCGCPGSAAGTIRRPAPERDGVGAAARATECAGEPAPAQSELTQWPVQIKLVPERAPFFDGAHLLVAADCTAFAYGDFHRRFIRRRVTLVGCPKLDEGDYAEKLTRILAANDVRSLTVVRMEVPCCGGLESAAKRALQASGKFIPWQVYTISRDGRILED